LAHIASGIVGREKIRYILMLVLFFICLPAAWAADDPVTKRNNDASTPVLIKSLPMQPFHRPFRPDVKPAPEDLGPTK
jgi:hypothetical protein